MNGPARVLRGLLGGLGLLLIAAGARLLVTGAGTEAVLPVAAALAGAVVAHDLVLVPLVLLAGAALRGVPGRGVLRGGLVVAGCLTLVALPVLLRPGEPRNPSALPLDYPRNWALLLAGTAVVCATWWLVERRRARRHRRRGAVAGRSH